MKIIVGKNSGFCFGVQRAVDGVQDQISRYRNIKCLGHLVHNETVTNLLESKGVTFVDNISQVDNNSILAIRAHGVPENVYEEAKARNITILDYTCPKVSQIHGKIKEASNNGYQIILIGKKDHPEVVGSKGYASNVIIIENINDVYTLKEYNKVFAIVQTTFSYDKYKLIEKELKKKYKNIICVNSICQSTKIRQEECKKIAKQSDFMIIIGGKNSSNTQKLYDIASNINKNCIIIQDENDKKIEDCKKYDIIGIMSGASTPNCTIDNVIEKINNNM